MVWHALLLNPMKYKTFCNVSGREEMLKLQFPWLLIVGFFSHIHGLGTIADHAYSIAHSLIMIPV
jgi:hypothetical protein